MKRSPLKKTGGLKKYSQKRLGKIKEEQEKKREMFEFFRDLWNATSINNRKCESCGKALYEPVRSYYYDHLLEKSSRPDLVKEPGNIFMCCLTCHSLKTSGFPTEKHQEAINKAKERFGIS